VLALSGGCGSPGSSKPDTTDTTDTTETTAEPASDASTPTERDTGTVPDCAVDAGPSEDGWVEVPLADHPGLDEPGTSVVVALPEALLYVIIACVAPDCWIALWSTCTHGACALEWQAESLQAWCPCHGSLFDATGTVVRGPADRDLAAFPVGRRGDSLWVHRPL
jgi:Rieske Fe-S protein